MTDIIERLNELFTEEYGTDPWEGECILVEVIHPQEPTPIRILGIYPDLMSAEREANRSCLPPQKLDVYKFVSGSWELQEWMAY